MSSQSPLGTAQLLDYYHSPHSDTSRLNNDKRRLAVVELDSAPPSSLLARRRANGSGSLDHSVLLVAPPDASPSSYSQLSPPEALAEGSGQHVVHARHHWERGKSSPKDVGLFGLTPAHDSSSSTPLSPAFQSVSHSPFPSQHSTPVTPSSALPLGNNLLSPFDKTPSSGIITPAIGQEKDPMARVAGPVVVGLAIDDSGFAIGTMDVDTKDSSRPRRAQQVPPGVNTTTSLGVLSPPPRPPRRTKESPLPSPSLVAITEGKLQRTDSDYSLVAVSASSSDDLETAATRSSSAEAPMEAPTPFHHKREGAFPPSVFLNHTKTADVSARPPRTPSPSPISTFDPNETPTANNKGRAPRSPEDEEELVRPTFDARPSLLKSRFSSYDTRPSTGSSNRHSGTLNDKTSAQIGDSHLTYSVRQEKREPLAAISSNIDSVSSSLENFTLQVGEAIENLGLTKPSRSPLDPSSGLDSFVGGGPTGGDYKPARSRERSRSPTKMEVAPSLKSSQIPFPQPQVRSAFSRKYRTSLKDAEQHSQSPTTTSTTATEPADDVSSPTNQSVPPSAFPLISQPKEVKRASQLSLDRHSLDDTSSLQVPSLKSKLKRSSTVSTTALGLGSPSPSKRDDRRLSNGSSNSGGGMRRRLSLSSRHSGNSGSAMTLNSVLGSLGLGGPDRMKDKSAASAPALVNRLGQPHQSSGSESGAKSTRSSRSLSMRFSAIQQRAIPSSFNSPNKTEFPPPVPRLPPSPTHTTRTNTTSNLKTKPGHRRDPITGELIKFHIGIVSSWPEALVSTDVPKKQTSLERCHGYAKKMNQLFEEESGLAEWVESIKFRGRSNMVRRDTVRSTPSDRFISPTSPTAGRFNGRFQTRQVSNGSNGSNATEVTFPVRRNDAYVATDLPLRKADETVNGPPAGLPYPGIFEHQMKATNNVANNVGLKPSASVRTYMKAAGGSNGPSGGPGLGLTGAGNSKNLQSLASNGKGGGNSGNNGTPSGGFFASIGRKASLSMAKPLTSVMRTVGNGTTPLALPPPPSPSAAFNGNNGMGPVRSRSMLHAVPGGQVHRVNGPRPLPSSASKQQQGQPPSQHRATPSRASTILGIARRSNESEPKDTNGAPSIPHHFIPLDYEGDAATESDVGSLPVFSKTPAKSSNQLLGPRPSLSYRTSVKSTFSSQPDSRALFNVNLDKLNDLLPHVDRPTLSLYLNRAGGDDLKAIGMYVEDEKKGMVAKAF